jgi:hypothetical protein
LYNVEEGEHADFATGQGELYLEPRQREPCKDSSAFYCQRKDKKPPAEAYGDDPLPERHTLATWLDGGLRALQKGGAKSGDRDLWSRRGRPNASRVFLATGPYEWDLPKESMSLSG